MGLLTVTLLIASLVSTPMVAVAETSEEVAHPDKAVCRVCAARSTHGTDPEAEEVAGTSLHNGTHYYFCSDECKTEFDASPEWWAPLELPFAIPDLGVRNLTGDVVPLEVGGGQLTILDFWATWCQPCRKTMRELQELYATGDQDLRIIGLSIDEGKNALKKVRKAIKSQGIDYPIFLDDQDSSAWAALKVYAVPTIMLVDGKGNVVWRFTGPDGDQRLKQAIKALGPTLDQ